MLKIKFIIFLSCCLLLVSACSTYSFKKGYGEYYRLQEGETIDLVSKKFKMDAFKIRKANMIIDEADLMPGILLFIPDAKPSKLTHSFPDQYRGRVKLRGGLIWPSPGTISSGFGKRHGKMHQGIDLTKDEGRGVVASAYGIVEFAGRQRGYGNTLILDHGSGVKTLYAHNKSILVRKGQRVRKGKKIAIMGNSGRSTGIHLHFEIRVKGMARDPLRYLPPR